MDQRRVETFSMTSDPEELLRMRSWLWTMLVGENLALDDCSRLLLAVGELCNNSIKHAYGGAAGQPIHVSLEATADQLVIEVEDWGTPFDPAHYVAPDLETVPDRGMGIFLVNSIADRVAVDVERSAGTRWTLVKYRPRTDGGAVSHPFTGSED
jgi:anti-sigma regulatory factor (Ser/Thr protein kinase)